MPGGAQQHDYPPVNNASTCRKPTSEPHKTPNITATVFGREMPPSQYAYDRSGSGHSIFLPDNGLRYWRLRSTRLRSGIGRKDMVKTTTTSPPPQTAQKISSRTQISFVNNASTRRKLSSKPHETQTLQPQYLKESCAPLIYAHDRK